MEGRSQTHLQALEKAYAEHRVAVYHTALGFVKAKDAAEDICQEVFLSLYGEWQQGGRIRHLRAWLLTATRNRCINYLRDRKREEPTEEDSTVWDLPARDDDELLVKDLLGRLPEEQRLVFCLHCLDGYSYREIAEGLSLPVGTVQTRVRSARKRLKDLLNEKEDVR